MRSWGERNWRPHRDVVALERIYIGTGLARVVVRVAADVRRAHAQEDEGWGDQEEASEV